MRGTMHTGGPHTARGLLRRGSHRAVLTVVVLVGVGLMGCDDDPGPEDVAMTDEPDAATDLDSADDVDPEPEPEPEAQPDPGPEPEPEPEPEEDPEELWAQAEAALEVVPLPDGATTQLERTDEPGVLEGTFDPGTSYSEAQAFINEGFDAPEWDQMQAGSGGDDQEQFAIWEHRGHDVVVRIELTGHGPRDTTVVDGILRISTFP